MGVIEHRDGRSTGSREGQYRHQIVRVTVQNHPIALRGEIPQCVRALEWRMGRWQHNHDAFGLRNFSLKNSGTGEVWRVRTTM